MIQKDMGGTDAAQAVDRFYRSLFRPGQDHLWSTADLDPTADGRHTHFTGQHFPTSLEDGPASAIWRLDLPGGTLQRIGQGRLYRNAHGSQAAYIEDDEGQERIVVSSADARRFCVTLLQVGIEFRQQSAVFAQGSATPTLVLAGGRNKNRPTGQAVEFFGALVEAGVESALAVYPEDDHSLRGYPAYLDSAVRIVDWLNRHLQNGRL